MRSDGPAAPRGIMDSEPPTLLHRVSTMTGPAVGYAFIAAVCVIWVFGSFLVESLEGQGLSPLLLTFICNALFVVLLPVYFVKEWALERGDKEWRGWGAETRGGWQRLTGFEGDEMATTSRTEIPGGGTAGSGNESGDGGFGGETRGSGRRQRRTFSDEELELDDQQPPPSSPPRPAAPRPNPSSQEPNRAMPTGRARDGEGDGVGGVHDLATVVRRTAVLQLQPPLHLSHIEQHTEHVLERVHLWPLSVLSWVNGTTRNAYAQSPRTSSGRCW